MSGRRMSERALGVSAHAALGVALLLSAASLALVLAGRTTPLPGGWGSWTGHAVSSVAGLGAAVLGWFIATRRPRNPIGWLWMGIGLALSVLLFGQTYAAFALLAAPGALPLGRTLGTVGAGIGWQTWLILTPLALLVFPTGGLPSPRWRLLVGVVLAFGTLSLLAGPFVSNAGGFIPLGSPFAAGGAAGRVAAVATYGGTLVVLATIPLALLSLVFRFRRAGGIERQQIKWFTYAVAILVLHDLVQFFYEPPGAWDNVLETLTLLGIYAAIGVAVLRYRLFDIDLVINRTLVYGLLSVSLILVYLGSVVTLQYLFRVLAGGESGLAVVASTLAIAALFNPLRRRVQGFVDRGFYRQKYDARQTLEGFARRLRDETDLAELSEELTRVVRVTVVPEHVSLWLAGRRRPP